MMALIETRIQLKGKNERLTDSNAMMMGSRQQLKVGAYMYNVMSKNKKYLKQQADEKSNVFCDDEEAKWIKNHWTKKDLSRWTAFSLLDPGDEDSWIKCGWQKTAPASESTSRCWTPTTRTLGSSFLGRKSPTARVATP
ncbi:unnamed protein product [Prorocentrum cordatum]|uniref:Phospholipase B-like n=1 Tax=Prorocentrum cordatum TaxID=2364126 RepID=A0ABN9TJ73_9DINO|nr:unnamed protein product [Polarella glacialis]